MAPRAKHHAVHPASANRTLVIDNGGFTIKAGFAGAASEDVPCSVIPNCIARSRDKHTYVGAQISKCTDFGEMAFRRPVEKGYIVNWEAQKEIWDHTFFVEGQSSSSLYCDPRETNLLLTEAPNAPQALQTNADQIVFEEFQFASYYRCLGPSLNAYADIPILFGDRTATGPQAGKAAHAVLVVDCGYSHTTVTPVIHGRPIQPAIRRMTVGGKFLTNYLKELISIRHYGLMDEPHLVNEIKEDVCFVSQDFTRDLERAWTRSSHHDPSIVLDYVLPDYEDVAKGYSRPHTTKTAGRASKAKGDTEMTGVSSKNQVREDTLVLGNERFAIPELLFNPGDIGVPESGLTETIMQSLHAVPRGLWPALLANVLLTGGTANIPGFVERIERDLRCLAPSDLVLRVLRADDPVTSTFKGATRLASNIPLLKSVLITKQQYEENGAAWVAGQFGGSATLG